MSPSNPIINICILFFSIIVLFCNSILAIPWEQAGICKGGRITEIVCLRDTLFIATSGGIFCLPKGDNEIANCTERLEGLDFYGLDIIEDSLYGHCSTGIYRKTGDYPPWYRLNFAGSGLNNVVGRGDTLLGEWGTLFRSVDYGETWERLDSVRANNIFMTEKSVYALNHVWVDEKILLKSFDNGYSWDTLQFPNDTTVSSIQYVHQVGNRLYFGYNNSNYCVFKDESLLADSCARIPGHPYIEWLGYSVGDTTYSLSNYLREPDTLFLSGDTGKTWSILRTDFPKLDSVYKITMVSGMGDEIFASNGRCTVFRLKKNSDIWEMVGDTIPAQSISELKLIGSDLFASTYFGGILRSTDYGESWEQLFTYSSRQGFYFGASVIDINGDWYAIGAQLPLLPEYEDKIIPHYVGSGPGPTANINGCLVMKSHNTLYRSFNMGNTWEKITSIDSTVGTGIFAFGSIDTTLLIGTTRSLAASHDSGNTWQIMVPTSVTRIQTEKNYILASKNGGNITFVSKNRGITWTDMNVDFQKTFSIAVINDTIFTAADDKLYWADWTGDSLRDFILVEEKINNRRIQCVEIQDRWVFIGTDGEGVYRCRIKDVTTGIIPQKNSSLIQTIDKIYVSSKCNLIVHVRKSAKVTISLYDIRGRKISSFKNYKLNPGLNAVRLNKNLGAGTYILSLQKDRSLLTKRLVIF